MKNAKTLAREMRAEAKKYLDEAARLTEAANILDPEGRPKRKYKKRTPKAKPVEDPGLPRTATVLELGTRGRTSHPLDTDAEALRDSLVHTTEGPA